MITFQIEKAYKSQIDTGRLQKAVSDTLFHQQFQPSVDVAIVIGDNDHIQSLNQTYRGIDEPTDVLTFPHGVIDPDTGREYLGDIVIAYPQAAKQAEAGGHPVMDELVILVVHATLHLLGYDHETNQQKRMLWSVQDDILDKLGISARPHD